MEELIRFLKMVPDDPRLATAHISVFVSLWRLWIEAGMREPLSFNRQHVMAACKISGFTTYHKTIKQLDEYGYIGYVPSFNHFIGSRVYFTLQGIAKWKIEAQLL